MRMGSWTPASARWVSLEWRSWYRVHPPVAVSIDRFDRRAVNQRLAALAGPAGRAA